MRRVLISALLAVLAAALAIPAAIAAPDRQSRQAAKAQSATQRSQEFVVLYAKPADAAAARAAIAKAGGQVVKENAEVGVATVRTTSAGFAKAVTGGAVAGVARNRVIGVAPKDARAKAPRGRDAAEAETRLDARRGQWGRPNPVPQAEPLAGYQWDMQQIDATVDGSYAAEQGDKRVKVAIIDTGIDGTHPDIAPNFDRALSRNFTVDIPADANGDPIDGPCEDEPDKSCNDPADVDENEHGTHVASTIGSPINGLGIAGVAPNVTLVNLRAGQDSGYFFLQPTVDALTFAGDHGIDVANMSYYVDPWLFNCTENPADSPEDLAEQRVIRAAAQRALDYAHRRGVTLVAAAGNEATDLSKPSVDATSPDFADTPGEAPHSRPIDPAKCTSMPAGGRGVVTVSSTGVSTRKAYYSNYGLGAIEVAAPGGDVYDTPDNHRDISRAILAAYPESLARANGDIDADGNPVTESVIRDCANGVCAYYQWLQGTSMASPHAAGVAALIVSRYGVPDRFHGGKTLLPIATETILQATATPHACPVPPTYTYTRITPAGATITATATCEGTTRRNGFYGSGIVNALAAVGAFRSHP